MNNREIKFRAYCNIDKKMYQYALIGQNGALDVHADEVHVGRWKNIGCGREDGVVDYSFELLQFTGLKDVNGKEIYEGDMVRLAGYGEYEVTFPFIQLYESSYEGDILDVIGNVFENPSLLK